MNVAMRPTDLYQLISYHPFYGDSYRVDETTRLRQKKKDK